MIHSMTGSKFVMKKEDKIGKIQMEYKLKYGEYPPGFIVLAPSQSCNLQCTGCYAGSTKRTVSTLPYSVVDRIIGDVHDVFGRKFVVITGGEPFIYKSDGKTLLDIFEKYNDVFFLVYTNGYRALNNGKSVAIPGFVNTSLVNTIKFIPRKVTTQVLKKLQELNRNDSFYNN